MIELHNRQTGLFESAEVVSPAEAADIACYTNDWRPVFELKKAELRAAGRWNPQGVADCNIEDCHWEWPQKIAERLQELRWACHVLRCAGKAQGFMFTDNVRLCRHPAHVNRHMIYVDLLSTAPWNRPRLSPAPVYRGTGLVLLTEALLLSRDEGFEGRLGLHALPKAEAFYRDQVKMLDLGPDPNYGGLRYFEMTSDMTDALLKP